MKIIKHGKLHWSIQMACLNLTCQAMLEVEEKDFYNETRILTDGERVGAGVWFNCPECETKNLVSQAVLNSKPDWLHRKITVRSEY